MVTYWKHSILYVRILSFFIFFYILLLCLNEDISPLFYVDPIYLTNQFSEYSFYLNSSMPIPRPEYEKQQLARKAVENYVEQYESSSKQLEYIFLSAIVLGVFIMIVTTWRP